MAERRFKMRKQKKPFYKRFWFWVLVVFLVVYSQTFYMLNTAVLSQSSYRAPTTTQQEQVPAQRPGDTAQSEPTAPTPTPEPEPVIEYVSVDLQTMLDDLDTNALRAEQTYQNAYVELVGQISNIDSDGKYISIKPVNCDSWKFDSVQCFLKTDEHRAVIMNKNKGDTVTVRGQISSIGEIQGYKLTVHTIS